MIQSPGTKVFFHNLDGLRFLSFFYVFIVHSFPTDQASILNTTWYQVIKGRLFVDGEPGVSFFFVLSGFLITFLLLKENESTNTIDIKNFYIRRILRIWPLYYFCVFFGFIVFPYLKEFFGSIQNETANPFLSSIFLNNYDRIINGPPDASVLSVLWSVAVEEQFYLLWPLFFFFVPRKYYSFIFIFIIEVSILYRITNYYGNIDINSLGVVTDMAVGGLGAFLTIRYSKFVQFIERSHPLVNIFPYVAVILYIIYKNDLFVSPILVVHRRLILGILFIWIILEQNLCRRSYFKIGNFRLVSRLGKYTYGLYCLHTIALLVTITFLNKLNMRSESWQFWLLEFPIAIFLSLYFSYLSYNYFESHFLKLKKKFMFIEKG